VSGFSKVANTYSPKCSGLAYLFILVHSWANSSAEEEEEDEEDEEDEEELVADGDPPAPPTAA
jgi:hypothetical protein